MMMSFSVNVNPVFFIVFTIQYCIITLTIYGIDLYKRWKMEHDKPLWIDAKYFPSWTHFRFTMIFVSCSIIAFSTMLIPPDHSHIQRIMVSLGWFTLFTSDWIVTVVSAAVFLMIKYQKRTNPVGNAVAALGSIAIGINIIIAIHSSATSNYYDFNLYSAIQFIIYLGISVPLEAIYFHISFIFVFRKDSSVCAGIYGFLDGFVRPLFRSFYCMLKYLIVFIVCLVSLGDYVNSKESIAFHSYVLPFLLEAWFVACFFTMRRNRPHPPQCMEVMCWRPFIEIFWRYAVRGYNGRNSVPLRRNIEWADMQTLEKNRKRRLEMMAGSRQKRSPKSNRNSSHSKGKRSSIKKIEKVRDDEPMQEND
eukprot:219896_1